MRLGVVARINVSVGVVVGLLLTATVPAIARNGISIGPDLSDYRKLEECLRRGQHFDASAMILSLDRAERSELFYNPEDVAWFQDHAVRSTAWFFNELDRVGGNVGAVCKGIAKGALDRTQELEELANHRD